MKTVAILNQKGGVGKTTTTVNIGHALALQGNRVALADLDPQNQLAPCLGIFRPPRVGMDEVLLNGAPLLAHRIITRELLQLIPAGQRLQQFRRDARLPGAVGGPAVPIVRTNCVTRWHSPMTM